MNLYLYIPANSAHPPSSVRGLIRSRIQQVFRLTSDEVDRTAFVQRLICRLRARGHHTQFLRPLFLETLTFLRERPIRPTDKQCSDDTNTRFFLHVHYHPNNPPNHTLQRSFVSNIKEPSDKSPLSDLKNRNGKRLGLTRLTIALHRPPNLQSLLTSRRFRAEDDAPVSSFLTGTS